MGEVDSTTEGVTKKKKKWEHNPCPYHENNEECPVCDDPFCDCGNPGWACECTFDDD
jgi:hypothetical protein